MSVYDVHVTFTQHPMQVGYGEHAVSHLHYYDEEDDEDERKGSRNYRGSWSKSKHI